MDNNRNSKGQRPLVILDLDDTIANLSKRWVERLNHRHCLHLDYMEIKGYDLSPIGDNLTWEEKEAVLLEPGLFRSLEVIPEAKLGVYRLLESCEVIIATALPKGGAITAAYDKTKWVEENFPAVSWEERIIFTHRKELIRPSDNKRMTVIIDDNPEILRRVSPNTYQIVYSQPWNKKYIPSLPPARRDKVWRSGDWSKIPDYIRSLARRS